jgi:hypothetical protein
MGLLDSLFGNAAVDSFARDLANDIAKRYPVAIDQDPARRPSVNRLTRIVEDVCTKAVEYQSTHRLGWYGKAKLGNTFRWELSNMGYGKDFVDLATEALIVYVSRKAAPASR